MNNEPVAWMIQYKDRHKFVFEKPTYSEHILACEPLYTHQYERPHNTVLVPCDKLAEMQAEIEALKAAIISENEACAQILLDSYDTTEPYEYISPDWLLTLVDLIDDRVGRVRT